jgi:hypothetical protein
VAKIWRIHACRSVLITEGKTADASTRADRESERRAIASSFSSCRTGDVLVDDLNSIKTE